MLWFPVNCDSTLRTATTSATSKCDLPSKLTLNRNRASVCWWVLSQLAAPPNQHLLPSSPVCHFSFFNFHSIWFLTPQCTPMSFCAVNICLFTPHEPTLCSPLMCLSSNLLNFFPQNQDQLKEPDADFLNGDGDLTFTFGDASVTANGASGGGVGGGDDADRTTWSSNGKRSTSTSEEALERELDSREQELLSRGTRLVFPMEEHAWWARPPSSARPPRRTSSEPIRRWEEVASGPDEGRRFWSYCIWK